MLIIIQELVFEKEAHFTQSDQQTLKPHNVIPFATWKQILQAGVAQKYKASNSPGRAKKALEEVFKKYDHASYDQKVEMVTNVILQNHIMLSINSFIQGLYQLKKKEAPYQVVIASSSSGRMTKRRGRQKDHMKRVSEAICCVNLVKF
ncbi:hypothetical protein JVT61DRAFT_13580 [Boletus reticuloceps]|uniref:Uncharacterized protein n=1 Tax=Boletus reticuloceps TaxID=495285 RepID=A0A8I2YD95_9AGAM|nr:hypothetical protein JVT61DRAFT_13580 [Boletus reticuloceps]